MKLSYKLDGAEHWVQVNERHVWTRRRLREWFDGELDSDDAMLAGMAQWAGDCQLTDEAGTVYRHVTELSSTALDELHPAVVAWLYRLPTLARNAQAALGEASGGGF